MSFIVKSNYMRSSGGRGMHKYVKRTGTPGNYKYWYKLPDGGLGTVSDEHQAQGKRDHARRLMIAHLKEKASLGSRPRDIQAEVARRTGSDRDLRNIWRNLQGERGGVSRADRAGYSDEHLDEAHGEAHSEEHPSPDDDHVWHTPDSATETAEADQAAETESRVRVSEPSEETRAQEDRAAASIAAEREPTPTVSGNEVNPDVISDLEGRGFVRDEDVTRENTDSWSKGNTLVQHRGGQWAAGTFTGEGTSRQVSLESGPHDSYSSIQDYLSREPTPVVSKKKTKKKKAKKKVTKKVAKKTAKKVTKKKVTKQSFSEMSDEEVANLSDAELEEFLSGEHGVSLTSEERQAKESAERIAAAKSAIRSVEPEYESGEDAAEAMTEEQSSDGGNPYLSRAKAAWDEVKGPYEESSTPSHAKHVENMKFFMQALDSVEPGFDGKYNESMVFDKFKEISGRARIRGLSDAGKSLEATTGMTLREVLDNPVVNQAEQAMRAGYPMKQFNRIKPFLKDSWVSANESAPPPFPTFGDIKTWGQHGGDKPSWAGTTRTAVPKEVFDASIKEGGKPKYPPAWMPIHMMPLWNYTVKSVGSETAYQARSGVGNIGPVASSADGVVINSIRKYILRRGGPDQLVDIPERKLEAAGTTQEEIFRSELSDQEIKKIMTTKHIPLEEVIPHIDEELGTDKVKKSFVSRRNKKRTKFVCKGGMGSGRHKGTFTSKTGSVVTQSRRDNLAEQKKKYEAQKKLDEGKSDDYYKYRMSGGKVGTGSSQSQPKPVIPANTNEGANAPKTKRPDQGTVTGGSKPTSSSTHKDYLRRIGAIGKSEKFVVRKDTE